ncbi:thiosulfate sulfurtransferase [Marinomonas sp. SBI22]|uniref:sulfurtransferase n=1 Tax=unclassified Marinomonas TaxID=196814 RepID=UPI0007AF4D14|nr:MULTISPECIES: sulfurtransferase [unclassified Marinomonas]KZM39977.1 thiosulfate sulfurtransferase [Marinomonas sp. SBI22]KZM41271.1 thiosulfate sulfurtransferase [Marinomonas sp. SBI8L]
MRTLISAQALKSELANPDLIILDSRFYLTDLDKGLLEYNKGHIPGALFVDLHHDLASPENEFSGRHPLPAPDDFSLYLQKKGIKLNSKVVVYDDMSGAIAARAWWMLAQNNIDVRVLDGGINAWLAIEGELETVAPTLRITDQSLNISFPWAVSEEDVLENMETESFQLLDARASDRFEGQNETMDPLAGHIPGALNRPFPTNLDSQGTFLSSESLAQDFKQIETDLEIVHYCGSGVTACHNVLANLSAAGDNKRVFIGSWSQWSKRMLRLMTEQQG